MAKYRNYTDKQLQEATASSTSCRQVLIKLGLAPKGGNYGTFRRNAERLRLDTSHFLGQGHNRGKEALNQRPIEDYLSNKARIRSSKLRERLIREGYFERQCSSCRGRTWLGLPMPPELDHINGDPENNRLNNLRLLCPNCHARTPTYRRSKSSLTD